MFSSVTFNNFFEVPLSLKWINFGHAVSHPPVHIHSQFVLLVCLTKVPLNLQSEFSTDCDLVLPLTFSITLSSPLGRAVVSYVFFLVFPSLLPFLQ